MIKTFHIILPSAYNDLHQRLAAAKRSGAVDSPLDVIVSIIYF